MIESGDEPDEYVPKDADDESEEEEDSTVPSDEDQPTKARKDKNKPSCADVTAARQTVPTTRSLSATTTSAPKNTPKRSVNLWYLFLH